MNVFDIFLQYLFGGMLITTVLMLVYAVIKELISDFIYYRDKYFNKK
jgi:hypothetical protein